MKTVLLADVHRIVCIGVRSLLEASVEFRVVGEAYDGAQTIASVKKHHPNLLIMDIDLPTVDGIAVCREITKLQLNTNVLFLSSHLDDRDIFAAIDAGASGYVSKYIDEKKLIEAIHAVSQGHSVFDSDVTRRIYSRFKSLSGSNVTVERNPSGLSPREMEVLTLICKGMRNEAIAKQLYVSQNTVKTHISHVLRKLGAKTRTEAVALHFQDSIVMFAILFGISSFIGISSLIPS